ncbi:MAG: LLM class flavin-dependent oxidoreductase, partial [Dehalococcoidia bacterium]
MMKKVRIGMLVPTYYHGEMPGPREFIEWFRAVERLGFDSIWVLDRIVGSSIAPDPLVVLAWASGVTSRVRLGTGVLLLPHRNPVLLAKEVATLDYVSGGRLDLGVGLGRREAEFAALGLRMKERVGRFRENLAIMKRLWSEPDVSYRGHYHTLEKVNLEPRPVQQGGVPIYVGGEVDGVLKRTAELADGWIGGSRNNPEIFSEKRQKIRDFAEARGRDPESLDCGNLMFLAVDEDRDRARERLRPYTTAVYGPEYDVDAFTTFGPPADCAARMQGFIDAGATNLVVCVPNLDIGQVDRIAQEVVP